MSDIHPHWDTTDADEQPVPVRITETKKPAEEHVQASAPNRFPAAIFGMIAIAAGGFVVFGGMDVLQGQIADDAIEIHINGDVLNPAEVTVQPGKKLRWINDSNIPHILASDTLKDADGKAFETTAIFPGSTTTYDLPTTTQPGRYEYVSRTSPAINGVIVVSGTTQNQPASSLAQSSSRASVMPVAPTVPSSAAAVTPVGGIPTNPYAIANTAYTQTSSSNGLPVAAAVTTHKPTSQPSTGMGLWLAGLAGVAALIIVLKRSSIKI
jgi:plastocyanin